MILICDIHCLGPRHAPFNGALVETIKRAFPDERVVFASQADHQNHACAFIALDIVNSVEYMELKQVRPAGSFREQFPRELRTFVTLARKFANEQPLLVLCGADAPTLLALVTALRLPRRFPGVQVILHGSVSEIIGWRSRNPVVRALDMRATLQRVRHPAIRYVVLEEGIRDELQAELPGLKPPIDTLPHPVNSAECRAAPDSNLTEPLQIGFLGLASGSKGFDAFLRLATRLSKSHGPGVDFHVCGRLAVNKALPEGANVLASQPRPAGEPLSRGDYLKAVRQYDYICMPFSDRWYRFSASGTLLDALAAGKPVIASSVPMMKRLFQAHGDLGYLCETEEEMVRTIQNLAEAPDPHRYASQSAAVLEAGRQRQPQYLSEVYRRITMPLRNLRKNSGQ